jgi:hypothetical protein
MKLVGTYESASTAQAPVSTVTTDSFFPLFAARFDDARDLYALFEIFLKHKNYSRDFTLQLLEMARQPSWELKRLSTLMLEHQLLKLAPDNIDEFDYLFVQLGLKPSAGTRVKMNARVLKEGYSTTDLRRFIPEFKRRLARLNRVHDPFNVGEVSAAVVHDFIQAAKRECKLTLARYLFRTDEVVSQIFEHVERSKGIKDINHTQAFYVDGETHEAFFRLPEPEKGILERLCNAHDIYWVKDSSSSEINSLVEYPLGTVVLVIKLPGSDLEFEIKRAGRKGKNKLGVAYSRNGKDVPPSHRLDGGSMQWLLRWEMTGASQLSRIYRIVHGAPPPMPQYHSRSNIRTVPSIKQESHILDYFTDPRAFGKSFREMRDTMGHCVRAFEDEHESKGIALPGDLGRTVQFLGFVTPCQAILSGTTSFRLDRVRLYLSARGPDEYFFNGLRSKRSVPETKQMTEEVLEEVLGVYEPPRKRYYSHERFVSDAFAVPANRARADGNYLSAMRQAGKFWGTLLAVRGYTWGESFVPRNVGLKSVWENGQWQVKLIFMDHDNLQMYGRETQNFHPHTALAGMSQDEEYFVGTANDDYTVEGSLQLLAGIYRVDELVKKRGETLLHKALKDAYRRTHQQLEVSSQLKRLFDKVFLKRIRDWDVFVGGYLRATRQRAPLNHWRKEASEYLSARDYTQELIDEYFKAVEDYSGFLERYSFLYTGKYLSLRRS